MIVGYLFTGNNIYPQMHKSNCLFTKKLFFQRKFSCRRGGNTGFREVPEKHIESLPLQFEKSLSGFRGDIVSGKLFFFFLRQKFFHFADLLRELSDLFKKFVLRRVGLFFLFFLPDHIFHCSNNDSHHQIEENIR